MAFLRGWEEWKKGERQKEREGRRERGNERENEEEDIKGFL